MLQEKPLRRVRKGSESMRKKYKWIFTCEKCERSHAYDKKGHAESHESIHKQVYGHATSVEKKVMA